MVRHSTRACPVCLSVLENLQKTLNLSRFAAGKTEVMYGSHAESAIITGQASGINTVLYQMGSCFVTASHPVPCLLTVVPGRCMCALKRESVKCPAATSTVHTEASKQLMAKLAPDFGI